MDKQVLRSRIINGAKYFKDLHPSDVVVKGIVKPTEWYKLQKYMELIREYFDEGEIK